jgi:hypothetical protein
MGTIPNSQSSPSLQEQNIATEHATDQRILSNSRYATGAAAKSEDFLK